MLTVYMYHLIGKFTFTYLAYKDLLMYKVYFYATKLQHLCYVAYYIFQVYCMYI